MPLIQDLTTVGSAPITRFSLYRQMVASLTDCHRKFTEFAMTYQGFVYMVTVMFMEKKSILAWIVIISVFTVVYGTALVRMDGMPVVPEGKPPIQNIQGYPGGEKCQRGLRLFIAINNLWLSISTVRGLEQIQGGHCTTAGHDLCGGTVILKFSLTI